MPPFDDHSNSWATMVIVLYSFCLLNGAWASSACLNKGVFQGRPKGLWSNYTETTFFGFRWPLGIPVMFLVTQRWHQSRSPVYRRPCPSPYYEGKSFFLTSRVVIELIRRTGHRFSVSVVQRCLVAAGHHSPNQILLITITAAQAPVGIQVLHWNHQHWFIWYLPLRRSCLSSSSCQRNTNGLFHPWNRWNFQPLLHSMECLPCSRHILDSGGSTSNITLTPLTTFCQNQQFSTRTCFKQFQHWSTQMWIIPAKPHFSYFVSKWRVQNSDLVKLWKMCELTQISFVVVAVT